MERPDRAEVQKQRLTDCRPDVLSAACAQAAAARTPNTLSMHDEQNPSARQAREQILPSQSCIPRAESMGGKRTMLKRPSTRAARP